MLLPVPIVAQRDPPHRFSDRLRREGFRTATAREVDGRARLEHAEGPPRVALAREDQRFPGGLGELESGRTESAFAIGEGAIDHASERFAAERLERNHPTTGEQGRDHAKGRVLGRRTDERHGARLDVREQRVLLRLVQAMDLVHEENRSQARATSGLDGFADLRHTGRHRGERSEACLLHVAEDPRQRRLATAGRPPENQGRQSTLGDQRMQRSTRCQQLLVADEIVEAPGAHAFGERSVWFEAPLGAFRKQVEGLVGGHVPMLAETPPGS